jgi:hypothetical protein
MTRARKFEYDYTERSHARGRAQRLDRERSMTPTAPVAFRPRPGSAHATNAT